MNWVEAKRKIKLLEELVTAQDTLLAAYRVGNYRPSAKIEKALDTITKNKQLLS